jgi:uncharacterized MAPEG superfamily protein
MTVAFWCVLVAALLPFAAVAIAKGGGERFNNRHPRAWLDKQQGFRARANAAQANSFEAFPFFAAAVIVAHLAGAEPSRLDSLALIFVAARLAYLACYLANWHLARSVVWMIGLVVTITIFVSGVGAH